MSTKTAARARDERYARGFTVFVRSLAECKDIDMVGAAATRLYPGNIHALKIKSAVSPGSTSDSLFAGPLAPLGQYAQGFIEYVRPRTVIGRMPELRRMPFRQRVPRATGGTTTAWVAPNGVIPVSAAAFDTLTPSQGKLATIVAGTDELFRFADPDADAMLREDLANSSAQAMDTSFLDPSITAIDSVRPAAITYGAPTVASTGTFATDFKNLIGLITTEMTAPYLIMRPKLAANIGTIDSQLTRDVGALGGNIGTIPVLTTGSAPMDGDSPSASTITLIDASEVFISDGGIGIDASQNATIQMETAPDSPPTASTIMTSFFQQNLTGLRLIRYLNWMPRKTGAVAVLTGVEY